MSMIGMEIQESKLDEAQMRIQLCLERKVTSIDLSDLGLSKVPDEIKNLTYLRSINLSENCIKELPDFIGSFTSLENLNIGYNKLSFLPEIVGNLNSLEKLDVHCNELITIPESIGKLSMLNFIDLSYNRLSALPELFNDLCRLEHCIIKGNNIDSIPEKINALYKPKQLTILQHIERVVSLSGRSSLSDTFFVTAKPHIDYIVQKLNITPIQAVFFSHIVEEYDDSPVSLRDIARSLNWSHIKIMQYAGELADLVNKRILKIQNNKDGRYCFNRGKVLYRIPPKVSDSLLKDEEYITTDSTNLTITEFFTFIEELFSQRNGYHEISYEELTEEIHALLSDNQELNFVKVLKKYNLSIDDQMLLIRFCHYYVNLDQDEMNLHAISEMFDHQSKFANHKRYLKSGEHNLIKGGIIENTNSDRFSDRESFKLTDKVKCELLTDLEIKKVYSSKDMIRANSIKEKKLFYNAIEAEQVKRFLSLLSVDSFKEIQNRLSENNMRTGFACLFYGPPGCGKTESVYQIARQTGRDIVTVDIAETKSMWFGESEKGIKEIFVRYRNLVDESEVTPILFINEADAVIGKRKDISKSSVAQTENAIQNIILQELENLKGILIATTNLTENMDKAFERRFLYKIEFKKPDIKVRQLIWKAMIPSLPDEDIKTIVSRFNFSGGQIENVARKRVVEYILSGIEPSFQRLITFCEEELLNKETAKPIGFRV